MDRLTQLQNLVHNLEELFSISTSATYVGPAKNPPPALWPPRHRTQPLSNCLVLLYSGIDEIRRNPTGAPAPVQLMALLYRTLRPRLRRRTRIHSVCAGQPSFPFLGQSATTNDFPVKSLNVRLSYRPVPFAEQNGASVAQPPDQQDISKVWTGPPPPAITAARAIYLPHHYLQILHCTLCTLCSPPTSHGDT